METFEVFINGHVIESLHLVAPNYLYAYYHNKDMNMYEREIGSIYEPRDNSWAIDIETGKSVHVLPVDYDKSELNSTFTVVSKPYYDTMNGFFNEPITKEFINVKSSNTGKIIRVRNY